MRKYTYVPLLLIIFITSIIDIWSEDYQLLRILDKIIGTASLLILMLLICDFFILFKDEANE